MSKRLSWTAPVVLAALFFLSTGIGCDGGRQPTSTEPQAENQRAKTPDERIDYLIQMIHRKQSAKKNAQAARTLGGIGAPAARAIPELEKVIAENSDPEVKKAAAEAITSIQAAVALEN